MDMRRFGLADALLLLVVVAAAGGVRGWYLYEWADNATTDGPVQVQGGNGADRDWLLQNLHRRGWFGTVAPLADREEATAHVSPAYPWLLSLAQDWTDDWPPLVRWAQGGLGTLTVGLYFLFARRAFRSLPVATLAGLLCAVHPFWVANTAEIADGVLASFLLAACLFLGARAGQTGGPTASLFYGLGLAGLGMVHAALLPFAFVAMLWFFGTCRTMKRGWLYALLAFLGFINGLVPWTLRNFQTYDDVIPVVDSAYLHLWIGNNSAADGGPQDPATLPTTLARDLVQAGYTPQEADGAVEGMKARDQNDRYRRLGYVVRDNVLDDPGAAVERRLWAGLCFVFGADWFGPEHRLAQGDPEYSGFLAGALLGMLLLGFLGWRWSYGWRRLSRPAALAVIWIPLPYLLGHAEALSGPRLPLDGVLLCYAAFALAGLLPMGLHGTGRALFRGPTAD
jgi:hypothetical protein